MFDKNRNKDILCPKNNFEYCRVKCAWYDSDAKSCSVKVIAEALKTSAFKDYDFTK
jgi:hypothetical protein